MRRGLFLVLALLFVTFSRADDSVMIALSNSTCRVCVQVWNDFDKQTISTNYYNSNFQSLAFRYFLMDNLVFRLSSSSDTGQWSTRIPDLVINLGNYRQRTCDYVQCPVEVSIDGVAYSYFWRVFPNLYRAFLMVQPLILNGYAGAGIRFVRTDSNPSSYISYHWYSVSFRQLIYDLVVGDWQQFREGLSLDMEDLKDLLIELQSAIPTKELVAMTNLYVRANPATSVSYSSFIDNLLSRAGAGDNVAFDTVDYLPSDWLSSSGDSTVDSFRAKALSDYYSSRVQKGLSAFWTTSNNPNAPYADASLEDLINHQYMADAALGWSYGTSYSTPLTNALQGLNGKWKEDVHNTLANIWDNISNRLDKRTWAGYVDKATNSLAEIASGQRSIADSMATVADNSFRPFVEGVKIQGVIPVELQTDNISLTIADGSIEQMLSGFDSSSKDAMRMWLEEWARFGREQKDYMSAFADAVTTNRYDNSWTNFLDDIYVALTNLDIVLSNVTLSATLLDDYDRFISSGSYHHFLGQLPDGLQHALVGLGLDVDDLADYNGRWWQFKSAVDAYVAILAETNATLAARMLAVDAAVSGVASNHFSRLGMTGNVLGDVSDLLDRFRTSDEYFDSYIFPMSNSVETVRGFLFDSTFSAVSNGVASALFAYYMRFPDSIPPQLTLSLGLGAPVVVPVENYRVVWDLLHYGVAWGISILSFILFPKGLLLVLRRLFAKFNGMFHIGQAVDNFDGG